MSVRRAPTPWLSLAVLCVLTGVSFWLKEVVDGAGGAARTRQLHHADLIVYDFSVHQLGDDGQTRYTLSARNMTHYPDDDSSEFEQVSLAAYEPGLPPLLIDARHGVRKVNEERVVFSDKVHVVRRSADPTDPPLVMNTELLEVFPDRKISIAPHAVELEHGEDRLEADNMVFNNKLSTAQFSRAKATFPQVPR